MSQPNLFTWDHVKTQVYELNGLRRPANYLFNGIHINGKLVFYPYCLAYINGKKSQQVKPSLVIA